MRASSTNPPPESPLDEVQRQLLQLLADGLSLPEAAAFLHVSRRTAERRLTEARAVLGVTTTAEAFLRASGQELGSKSDGLSTRERQVLELVGAGLRNEEIAERLGIAHSPVATVLRSSMAKLDARTRVEAVAKLAGIEIGGN
jgi:DNA-binding CsgD family transcriptional regulator